MSLGSAVRCQWPGAVGSDSEHRRAVTEVMPVICSVVMYRRYVSTIVFERCHQRIQAKRLKKDELVYFRSFKIHFFISSNQFVDSNFFVVARLSIWHSSKKKCLCSLASFLSDSLELRIIPINQFIYIHSFKSV